MKLFKQVGAWFGVYKDYDKAKDVISEINQTPVEDLIAEAGIYPGVEDAPAVEAITVDPTPIVQEKPTMVQKTKKAVSVVKKGETVAQPEKLGALVQFTTIGVGILGGAKYALELRGIVIPVSEAEIKAWIEVGFWVYLGVMFFGVAGSNKDASINPMEILKSLIFKK